MSEKVIVLGANGQLGKSFFELKENTRNWLFLSRVDLDITNALAVAKMFDKERPDIIINCAAYTAVDKAETETELADKINHIAVASITELCKKHNCLLIHYSSDYVYHSIEHRPITETDSTTPAGVYAATKLAGEEAIRRSGAPYFIIRTSWVYSPFNNNFVKTMLRLFHIKDSLSVVDDQIGAPSYTFDIVDVTLQLIKAWKDNTLAPGTTYNFANDGQISWYDFAEAIKQVIKADIKLHAIPTVEYPTPAKRPAWSVMNLDKIKIDLKLDPLPWHDSLLKCIARLQNKPA